MDEKRPPILATYQEAKELLDALPCKSESFVFMDDYGQLWLMSADGVTPVNEPLDAH